MKNEEKRQEGKEEQKKGREETRKIKRNIGGESERKTMKEKKDNVEGGKK